MLIDSFVVLKTSVFHDEIAMAEPSYMNKLLILTLYNIIFSKSLSKNKQCLAYYVISVVVQFVF